MKVFVLFLFLVTSLSIQAQEKELHLVLSGGIATYSMQDLKEFQSEFIKRTGVNMQVVAQFPPFVNFNADVGSFINSGVAIGVHLGYTSTGGRADYQDYSGMIRIDQLVNCISAGTYIYVKANASNKWPVYLGLTSTWIRSNGSFSSQVIIGDFQESESLKVFSNNLGIMPSVSLRYYWKPKIFLMAYSGYEINAPGKVYLVDNPELHLIKDNGDPLLIQWNGIRAGIGVGFRVNKME